MEEVSNAIQGFIFWKKRVGGYVVIEASSRVNFVTVAGEPVIPKNDVLRLIKWHPGLYAGAEELIEY